MKRYLLYIFAMLFLVALSFTSCTKMEEIAPAGDVQKLDVRSIGEGDDLLDDEGDSTEAADEDDEEEGDDTDGITDEDDDEDEDDSDAQRSVVSNG